MPKDTIFKKIIIDEIRKFFPKLSELRFGCEVKRGGSTYTIGCNIYGDTFNTVCDESELFVKGEDDYEIIGSPLYIEHLLGYCGGNDWVISITCKDPSLATVVLSFDADTNYEIKAPIYLSVPLEAPDNNDAMEEISRIIF